MFTDWKSIPNCIQNVSGVEVPTLNCIPALFQQLVYIALLFAGTVAVFMIIFAGYKFVSSGGDSKQVESAKQTMTWAIIGLVVIFTSFLLINVISGFTGIEQIRYFGF